MPLFKGFFYVFVAILMHLLVDVVHLAILQSLLYFESFEVEVVGVHFHESLPHAMSTVLTVSSVLGMHCSS